MDNSPEKMTLREHNEQPNTVFRKGSLGWRVAIIATIILLVVIFILLLVIVLLVTGTISWCKVDDQRSQTVIHEFDFGTSKLGEKVKRFELSNPVCGINVEVITLGATLKALKVPDKTGQQRDIVLGYDTLEQYEGKDNAYFGALVGRFTNRIANARFSFDGVEYSLSKNNGEASIHGGPLGWSYKVWDSEIKENTLVLSHVSPDGDEGYPGTVTAQVRYELTDNGELECYLNATTDKTTPINMALHPYFNLAGELNNTTMYDNYLTVYADRYLPVDDSIVPTGQILDVDGTIFDLRSPVRIGDRLKLMSGIGLDHNFCVNGPTGKKKAASVSHEGSGIVMDVYTNQPGLEVYSGWFVDVPVGKHGHTYIRGAGLGLEAQNYPDAPNHGNFPDSFLRPGSEYINTCSYKFSTQ